MPEIKKSNADIDFPNAVNIFIALLSIFYGVLLAVFISNNLTFFLEKVVSNPSILIVFHLFVICFLFHFVRMFLKYLESTSKFLKFDNNAYLDAIIIIGPTIGSSSNYLAKYIKYLFN